ncbi:MAG: hypothetical protein Q9222_006715 [Ikaeria aurantiellina]
MKELEGGMTRLDILAPWEFRWRPGQHCFLRIPELELLGNHPFTIASTLETFGDGSDKRNNGQLVSLYIRSHAGFTKNLATAVESHAEKSAIAWLEGPYGGIPYMIENAFDSLVLVAGGAGVTACLPWLEHLTAKRAANAAIRISTIKFIWVVRRAEHLSWASGAIDAARYITGDDTAFLEACFYISGDRDSDGDTQTDVEMGTINTALHEGKSNLVQDDHTKESAVAARPSKCKIGRPRMIDVIPPLVAEGASTLVVGCGPQSLKIDLSNVCAQLQVLAMRGNIEGLALHTETFGW